MKYTFRTIKEMIKPNHYRIFFLFLTIFFDWLAIALSVVFSVSYLKFFRISLEFNLNYYLFIAIFVFFVMMSSGVYRAVQHYAFSRQIILLYKSYFVTTLILLSILFIININGNIRVNTLHFLFFLPITLLFSRIFVFFLIRILRKKGYGVYNVLFVGYENGAVEYLGRFRKLPELGYNVVGIITNDTLCKQKFQLFGNYLKFYSIEQLEYVIQEKKINRIFVPSVKILQDTYSFIILECAKKYRIKIKILSPESEYILRIARVYDIAGITLYSPPQPFIDITKSVTKRIFDLIIVLPCIILLSPLFILTSFAILLESGSPILYKQKRALIKYGKVFNFLKFRSMVQNADELKENLYEHNETDGALFKLRDDPRVTKVGKFIRKYSIDELPQLFNVIKGDMSLVGPRPLPINDFEKAKESDDFWRLIQERSKFKAGVTGLWQISGRSHLGFRDMIWLDLYYIENQSILFDLEILFATIPVVLTGKGAY